MKIDLRDTTFLIPVHFDHKDRKDNLELLICMLQQNFDTNIVVGEQGGSHFEYVSQWVKYVNFDYDTFHRTRILNELAKQSDTQFVVNQDADCLIAPAQMWMAVEALRRKEADFVYPYEYLFVRVDKKYHKLIYPHYDLSAFAPIMTGVDTKTRPSVGGCVVLNRDKFLSVGGENENMIAFAPEDVERFERFTRMGLKCKRIRGHLYHLDHYVGSNSSKANPHYEQNQKELEKVRAMSKDELTSYIQGWPWFAGYTDTYRLEISPTAEQSAKEVFNLLEELGIYKGGSVIDIGGGVGSWGVHLEDYTCVDYDVPEKLRLTENFIDHNLNEPLKLDRKYDLAICLEVAEHLSPNSADTLVHTLTEASDTILFSAAIPNQGGYNHQNEQWPTYWANKFIEKGFHPYQTDIRQLLYDNNKVDLWYRNNLLIFTRKCYNYNYRLNFVHPEYYLAITNHLKA